MWRYGPGGGPGWWVLGSILWVAFWVAVVVVIVSLVRGRHHHHHGDQPGPSTPALRVLGSGTPAGRFRRRSSWNAARS